MGAIVTVTPANKRYPQRIGTRLEWEGTIKLPASYDAGGSVLSPKLLGMNVIEGGQVSAKSTVGHVEVIPQADGTAKLKAYVITTGVEASGDLSALVPFARIIGH